MLGLVDDIIGISEIGIKAQQMNALINVKTVEKGLRFGHTKCKTMVVGKNTETIVTNPLETIVTNPLETIVTNPLESILCTKSRNWKGHTN